MKDKYVGFDVHSATISGGYLDENGNVIMQTVFQTKAEAVRDFLRGIRGRVHVTLEQGTQAALALRYCPSSRLRNHRLRSQKKSIASFRIQVRQNRLAKAR